MTFFLSVFSFSTSIFTVKFASYSRFCPTKYSRIFIFYAELNVQWQNETRKQIYKFSKWDFFLHIRRYSNSKECLFGSHFHLKSSPTFSRFENTKEKKFFFRFLSNDMQTFIVFTCFRRFLCRGYFRQLNEPRKTEKRNYDVKLTNEIALLPLLCVNWFSSFLFLACLLAHSVMCVYHI